jgi:hypothetical protein
MWICHSSSSAGSSSDREASTATQLREAQVAWNDDSEPRSDGYALVRLLVRRKLKEREETLIVETAPVRRVRREPPDSSRLIEDESPDQPVRLRRLDLVDFRVRETPSEDSPRGHTHTTPSGIRRRGGHGRGALQNACQYGDKCSTGSVSRSTSSELLVEQPDLSHRFRHLQHLMVGPMRIQAAHLGQQFVDERTASPRAYSCCGVIALHANSTPKRGQRYARGRLWERFRLRRRQLILQIGWKISSTQKMRMDRRMRQHPPVHSSMRPALSDAAQRRVEDTFRCETEGRRDAISYCTALIMSKIGRYMATTMPPTTTPRNTIMIGSMSASKPPTAASTSSS